MKFRLMLVMLMTLMMFGCDTECGNSGGGGSNQPTGKTFAVSNIMFDSITLDLTADVNLADGTKLTLTCSGKSMQATVKNGKISLNVAAAFYAGIMGGKSYAVTFAATGYSNASGTIEYWPAVKFSEDLIERMPVYAGAAADLSEPRLASNYESDKVKTDATFSIYDTAEYDSTDDPAKLNVDTAGWTFADMKSFVTNADNAGKTVEYYFKITPKCQNGDALAASGYIVYDCKSEVLIKSVLIYNQSGAYTARLYAEDNTGDISKAETAGGSAAYQWQLSSDGSSWTDIGGATGKTFELTSSNADNLLNKYLRVQVTQTYNGSKQTPIVSASVKVLHTVVNAALVYNGSLKVGEEFDFTKISGVITDEIGTEYDASEFVFEGTGSYNYTAVSSLEFTFACRKDGFNEGRAKAYVAVQAVFVESELPSLVSDPYQLGNGKARFAGLDYRLEFSLDGGETYSDMTSDEFDAAAGNVITLRKKASGIPGENGYLKESDPLTLTVKEENVGKTTQGSGIIGGLEFNRIIKSFTLRSLPTDQTIDIVPVLDCAEDEELTEDTLYEYIWLIDGAEPSYYGIETDSETHGLVITKSELAGDAYQIECRVRIYNHIVLIEDIEEWDLDLDKGYANMTLDLR